MRRMIRFGFTIIEILIAIVVLVLGITGIVALFPTAIESGNKTVEDTYAATITQSVVDAISVGLRESRYTFRATAADGATFETTWTYFVFNHDGVLDKVPLEPEAYATGNTGGTGGPDKIWNKDYCIVLPQATVKNNTDSKKEPFFVYPIPSLTPPPSGMPEVDVEQRSPPNLRTGKLIFNFGPQFQRETGEGTPALWFARAFQLGRYRETDKITTSSDPKKGDIRLEYRGEDISSGALSTGSGTQSIAVDPYPTYSFTFAIKRARVDTAAPFGKIDTADQFSSSLYELRVYVFKNFDNQAALELATEEGTGSGVYPPVPKTNVPIRTFITLISL